jgi:2'-5' RNA ligase
MHRLFVGLSPPSDAAEALHAGARRCFAPAGADRLRFSGAGDLHMTVLFLGDVAEELVPDLTASLERSLASQPVLDLEIAGTGAFPSAQRPRVLWAGVRTAAEGDPGLDLLRAEVVRAVRDAGVGVAERETEVPFRAHITLARVRSFVRPEAARRFFALDFRAAWRVAEVALFRSMMERSSSPSADSRYPKILRIPCRPRT